MITFSGEVFAGGQLLNNPHPSMVGRQCVKQKAKDTNVLAGLGIVTMPAPSNVQCKNKVDRLLADTPGKPSQMFFFCSWAILSSPSALLGFQVRVTAVLL